MFGSSEPFMLMQKEVCSVLETSYTRWDWLAWNLSTSWLYKWLPCGSMYYYINPLPEIYLPCLLCDLLVVLKSSVNILCWVKVLSIQYHVLAALWSYSYCSNNIFSPTYNHVQNSTLESHLAVSNGFWMSNLSTMYSHVSMNDTYAVSSLEIQENGSSVTFHVNRHYSWQTPAKEKEILGVEILYIIPIYPPWHGWQDHG
jgi:hypothetical protein